MKPVLDAVNGKNILILGFGREGKSTYNFLNKYASGVKITVADANDVSADIPEGVKLVCGKDYQKVCGDFDLVIKSPGIVLEKDIKTDNITSQTELFLKAFGGQTIGITGTKGKSTVTTLLYHILQNTRGNCLLLGNIGIPPLDVADKIDSDTLCVFELSAHQMEYTHISPRVAVLLNLRPEHLDHYGTYEKYIAAKENIFLWQKQDDTFICGADLKPQIEKCVSSLVTVSMENDGSDVCLDGRDIVYKNGKITVGEDDTLLLGKHNLFDIAVVHSVYRIFESDNDAFKTALKTYKPLPHRMEYIGESGGVRYYDDSISTIGETAINALKSIKNVGSVIIGGMDRGIDYSDLIEFLKTYETDNIILIPDTGLRIGKELEKTNTNLVYANDLEDAVKIAKQKTPQGKACVLSPAAASYGFFKNFEARGDAFKKYVFENK